MNKIKSLSLLLAVLVLLCSCAEQTPQWPYTELTKGITPFDGEVVSVNISENAVAVFYESVKEEDATAYILALTDQTPDFSAPVVINMDSRVMTLLYSEESGNLSITFAYMNKE